MGGKKRRHRRRPCPPEKMASDTIQLIRRYLAYLLAYRTAFGGMILCMVLSALLEPLLPLLLKPLLDGNAEGATPFLRENLPYIMLLLVFLLAVLLYGRVYLGGWLDATLQKNLHTLMCERLLILPMARLGDESMGALTTTHHEFCSRLNRFHDAGVFGAGARAAKNRRIHWRHVLSAMATGDYYPIGHAFCGVDNFLFGTADEKNRGKKSTTHHALSNDIKRSGAT